MNKQLFVYCPQCKEKLQKQYLDGEDVLICPSCGFHYWQKPKPVVSILISKDGKVLMLQRNHDPFKNYWVLPGGFIRYDETPTDAICRETKEEIGLVPKIRRIIGAYRIDDDPRGVHIDIIYEGSVEGTIQLSEEDKRYLYVNPKNLPQHIAYKHRDAINDWIKINKHRDE